MVSNSFQFILLRYFVLAAIGAVSASLSHASIVIKQTPKFGAPLVLSNQLIFTWPDSAKPKIISIDRRTGAKIWESSVPLRSVQVWPTSKQPILTTLSNVFELNATNGQLHHRFSAPFDIESAREVSPNLLLLKSRSEDQRTNILSAVNTDTWRAAWTHTNVYQLLDTNPQRILVQFGEPDLSWRDTHYASKLLGPQFRNLALGLLSAEDGRVLWRIPASATLISQTALIADNYIVISAMGGIACISSQNGATLKRVRSGPLNTYAHIWREGAGIFTTVSTNAIATLDLPSLSTNALINKLDLPMGPYEHLGFSGDIFLTRGFFGTAASDARTGRRLWPAALAAKFVDLSNTDAHWAWQGVHDGFIYISRSDSSKRKTFIEAVDIKTGVARLLYSSPQPKL